MSPTQPRLAFRLGRTSGDGWHFLSAPQQDPMHQETGHRVVQIAPSPEPVSCQCFLSRLLFCSNFHSLSLTHLLFKLFLVILTSFKYTMRSLVLLSVIGAVITPAFGGIVTRQAKGKLPPVSVKGNAFYAGDERFYIRGVAYQPGM